MAEKITEQIPIVHPQTTRHRQSFIEYFIIAAAGAFGLLTFLAKTNPYFPFDLVITQSIQSIDFPLFDILMRFITLLGNRTEEVVLPILAATFLLITKLKKEALMILVSAVGAGLISELLKKIVARPRPDGTLIIQVGQFSNPDSFPSGHVLFFIGFFGFLAYLIYTRLEKNRITKLIVAVLLLMIVLIGVSRIYLGAHWFSDVLGSYLVGSVWLYLVIHLSRKNKVN